MDALSFQSSHLYTGILVGLFVAIFAYGSIESLDNVNRSFIIRSVPIWTFLGQAAGISVAIPLVWIPSFLWFNSSKNLKVNGNTSDFFGLKMVFFGICLFTLSCLSIDTFPGKREKMLSIMIFNVTPVLIPFLWIFPRFLIPQTKLEAGSRYLDKKISIYTFFAGMITMWYFYVLKEFIAIGMPFGEIFDLMRKGLSGGVVGKENAALFLLGDCASLLISMFVFDCVQNGFKVGAIVRFMVLSVFFSPGSAFFIKR